MIHGHRQFKANLRRRCISKLLVILRAGMSRGWQICVMANG